MQDDVEQAKDEREVGARHVAQMDPTRVLGQRRGRGAARVDNDQTATIRGAA